MRPARLIVVVTVALSLAVATGWTGIARAESPRPSPSRVSGKKSPTAAFVLSFTGTLVAGTAIPFAAIVPDRDAKVIGLGVALLAPSGGTLYAGEALTPGLALRSLGVAVAAGVVRRDDVCAFGDHEGCNSLSDTELYLLEAATAAIVVGGVWDSIRAVRTVNAHNARVDLTITPLVTPTSSGLALSGRF